MQIVSGENVVHLAGHPRRVVLLPAAASQSFWSEHKEKGFCAVVHREKPAKPALETWD